MTEALFLQFAALLAAALLAPSLVFLGLGVNHRSMPFWRAAAVACLLMFFGAMLVALRSVAPSSALIFLSNAVFGLGYFLSFRSMRIAKNCWDFYRLDLLLAGLHFVALILVVGFSNSYPARVVLFSSYIITISISAIITTYRYAQPTSSLGDAALKVFAIGNSVFSALRAGAALLGRDEQFLSLALWDQVFFIWVIAAMFAFGLGTFYNGTAMISKETRQALEKERLLTDALTEALEGAQNLKKLLLHELKRPLNSLTAAIDLSRKSQQGMPLSAVERIHQLVCVANEYLREIAEYEDIRAVFESPTFSAIEVLDLVKDIRNKWQLPVNVREDDAQAVLAVDLLLFDIAIGNLIENAQRFGAGRDPIQINVGTENNWVTFDVIDGGPGIPPDEAEKVFRLFYKIDGNQTNSVKGCGLGLHVVLRIASVHGGSCRVLSQSPSTLRLSLPMTGSPRNPHER